MIDNTCIGVARFKNEQKEKISLASSAGAHKFRSLSCQLAHSFLQPRINVCLSLGARTLHDFFDHQNSSDASSHTCSRSWRPYFSLVVSWNALKTLSTCLSIILEAYPTFSCEKSRQNKQKQANRKSCPWIPSPAVCIRILRADITV